MEVSLLCSRRPEVASEPYDIGGERSADFLGTLGILAVAAISTAFISLGLLNNGTLLCDLTAISRLLVLSLAMFDTVCPELSWNHTTEPPSFKDHARITGTVSSK
jgi:hypothetical protein